MGLVDRERKPQSSNIAERPSVEYAGAVLRGFERSTLYAPTTCPSTLPAAHSPGRANECCQGWLCTPGIEQPPHLSFPPFSSRPPGGRALKSPAPYSSRPKEGSSTAPNYCCRDHDKSCRHHNCSRSTCCSSCRDHNCSRRHHDKSCRECFCRRRDHNCSRRHHGKSCRACYNSCRKGSNAARSWERPAFARNERGCTLEREGSARFPRAAAGDPRCSPRGVARTSHPPRVGGRWRGGRAGGEV